MVKDKERERERDDGKESKAEEGVMNKKDMEEDRQK